MTCASHCMYKSYTFLLFLANFLRSMSTICSSSTLLYTSFRFLFFLSQTLGALEDVWEQLSGWLIVVVICDHLLSPDSSWRRCDGSGRGRILRWEEDACSDRCSQWQLLPPSPHSQSRPSGLEEPQSYCSWKQKTSLKTVFSLALIS